jgi:tetratricopeptide (TPR) repeat protein
MDTIFISYRRNDSVKWAKKLYKNISLRYGKDLVFQDVEDIGPGDIWLEKIRKELDACKVILLLIGPHWLINKDGINRLKDKKDILRLEILEALAGKKVIIPVLVGSAQLPGTHELPESIRPILKRQAVYIRDKSWNQDVSGFLDKLRNLILPSKVILSLSLAQKELGKMQSKYFDLINTHSADALELAQNTQIYLDKVLPHYPQDSYLKVTRGYLFKNEAMALIQLEREQEAEDALKQGEIIFRTMLSENSRDAGAWNGLGSIEGVRGNFEKAHTYIDKALTIMPDYSEAHYDHAQVIQRLGIKTCDVLKKLKKQGKLAF